MRSQVSTRVRVSMRPANSRWRATASVGVMSQEWRRSRCMIVACLHAAELPESDLSRRTHLHESASGAAEPGRSATELMGPAAGAPGSDWTPQYRLLAPRQE